MLLLGALVLRSSDVEEWFWRSVATYVPLLLSFRSAVVYAYRKHPSRLNWWLRPTPGVEREFHATWLVYAVLFGAASLVVVWV